MESQIPYTFLRPAYFMQNFTTILRKDLMTQKTIFLPAGNAKFTLIDVRDIGNVAANILKNTSKHSHKAYDLTNEECLSFAEIAAIFSAILGFQITYQSPNLLHFFYKKKKENMPTTFILVMIMLHYLPRLGKAPKISNCVETIIHQKPIPFAQFVHDNHFQL